MPFLYSKNLDRYYVSHTCDTTAERLRQHLHKHSGYTDKAKDWKLVYSRAVHFKNRDPGSGEAGKKVEEQEAYRRIDRRLAQLPARMNRSTIRMCFKASR